MTETEKKIRVLIVDDDETTAELLAQICEEMGTEVFIAHGGKDALQTYLNFHPHIVFSDYIMPDIDGIMLMKSLKALNPDLPFVLFSGYYSKLETDIQKETVKPDAVLRKPFIRVEKISDILDKYFPRG